MELPKDANAGNAHNRRAPPLVPSSPARFDLALILFTVVTGLLSGAALSLAFVGSVPLDILFLLGALFLIYIGLVLLVLRRRNAYREAEVQARTRAIDKERAKLVAALDEKEHALASQRAQIEALGNQAQQQKISLPLKIPLILGWQSLGMDEVELASQFVILAELFHGQDTVRITKKFSGGYRNRGVYLVRASAEAERVVKIARSADIRAETRAQELINRFSQNNGGQYIRDIHSAEDDALGGIVYRLASLRRTANVSTFAEFYRETHDAAVIAGVVSQLYSDVLPHSQFRHIHSAPLFQEYALPQRVLDKVWESVEKIPALRNLARAAEWVIVDASHMAKLVRNPIYWAEHVMPRYTELKIPSVRGVIHGDLHSGNVLIETPGSNLWIIDFAKTRDDAHTLADYARFEVDLKFHLLQNGQAEEYLAQAVSFEEMLLSPQSKQELDAPLELLAYNAEFQKAGASIAALRHIASSHQRRADDDIPGHFVGDSVSPYYLALFHATLRTLKYEQHNAAQKTFAFLSASLACDRITQLVT